MGGRVVLHLALGQADYFKAVIALEGSDKLDAYYDLDWLHRPDVHGGEIASAFVSAQVAPQSPDEFNLRNPTIAVAVNLLEYLCVFSDHALLDSLSLPWARRLSP